MKAINRLWLALAVGGILLGALLLLAAGQGVALAAPVSHAPQVISAGKAAQAGAIVYVVRRGDTLSAIGRRFSVSVATLMRVNHISNPNRIYIGQRLLIPTAGPTPTPTPGPTTVPGEPVEEITIIQPSMGMTITSPVTVMGVGRGFEQNLGVRILDASGFEIGSGNAMISGELGQRGPYTGVITFTMPANAQPGRIQVFAASPRDGAFEHLNSVSVQLPGSGLDATLEQLKTALEKADAEALRQLLGRPFLFGLYRSEALLSEDPTQVMDLLASYGLNNSTVFVDFSVDARPLLQNSGGVPPGVEHVAYSTGWGEDGTWSAFLYLGAQQGQMRWTGIVLVAPEAKDF